MAAGAPLIPEGALGVAALVDLLIALLDILALGVLLGMLWTYKHTIGAVIEFLVSHTTINTPIGSFSLLFPLDAANNAILHGMTVAALGLEIAAGRMFHALGVIFGWMVNLALYTATTMEHAVSWLTHVHIPKAAKWAALLLFPPALLAKLIADQVAKVLPHIPKLATIPVKALEAELGRVERGLARDLSKTEKTLAAALLGIVGAIGAIHIPHDPFTLPKAWRGLTKRLARIEARLHRLEALLGVTAFAAVMAQVLGVSAKCLRSGNVGKVARRLCGLSPTALEELLGLLVDVLIIEDICQVVQLLESGLQIIQGPIDTLVGAVGGSLCHGDYSAPPDIGPFHLSTAPTTGYTLS